MVAKGRCHDCGSYEYVARLTKDSDMWICEDCFYSYHLCACCEDTTQHEEHMVTDHAGKYICESCQDVHKDCYECEELFHEDDMQKDDNNNPYCDTCKEEGHGDWEQFEFKRELFQEY